MTDLPDLGTANEYSVSLEKQTALVWGPSLPSFDEVKAKIAKTGKEVRSRLVFRLVRWLIGCVDLGCQRGGCLKGCWSAAWSVLCVTSRVVRGVPIYQPYTA